MKPTLHTLAAALFAAAVPFAYSQATPPGPQPSAKFVEEPVASVSRPDDLANAIAQALIADSSMKQSKITVQPDENGILLTGATLTEAQRQKASQIATSQAGEGKVINAIQTDEIVIHAPPPQPSLDELVIAEPAAETAPVSTQ